MEYRSYLCFLREFSNWTAEGMKEYLYLLVLANGYFSLRARPCYLDILSFEVKFSFICISLINRHGRIISIHSFE